MNSTEPPFFSLARKSDLDQETAFTICRMIDSVGWDFVEDWNGNWLEGEKKDYRTLINPGWLEDAWKRLYENDWYSAQTTNDVDKKISTIVPLEGLVNLRSLVLQNNLITDLRPVSTMVRLRYLNCYSNRICDLATLRNLTALEELLLAMNPVSSFRVLEELPHLRRLTLSPEQIPVFAECIRLAEIHTLKIEGDGPIENFVRFPQMPALKVLKAWNVKSLTGLEQFSSLETINLTSGEYASLDPLQNLRALTHLSLSTSNALNAEPLRGLFALRDLYIQGRNVQGLPCLAKLPALHSIRMDDESACDAVELRAVREGLTSWDSEFKTNAKVATPSLDIHVVDQGTFDYFDSKAPFGIRPGECNEGMLASERGWLVEGIRDALSTRFEDDIDFHLPYTGGFQRSERVIIYSLGAYESFRDVAMAIQHVLCENRNDWIIWCQSLLWESPEEQDIPEDAEDFIVWIYPDKIMVTEEHAEIVRRLIEWRK